MNIARYFKKNLIRLFIGIALIILVAIVLLFAKKGYNVLFSERVKIQKIEDEVTAAVKKMETLIEFAQNAPLELATILEIHNVNKNESEILLKSILFNSPEFSGVSICYEPFKMYKDSMHHSSYLYRDSDSTIFTNFEKQGDNYFYEDWYLIPKTLMQPVWSEPYYNEIENNTLNSTYSVPFSFFNGVKKEFRGIVSLNLDVNALIDYSEAFGKSMNGIVFLISENGTILSANNKDWIFNETIFSLAAEYKVPILRKIGRELQRGNSGREEIKRIMNKSNLIVFYEPIKINNWGLLLFLNQTELQQ